MKNSNKILSVLLFLFVCSFQAIKAQSHVSKGQGNPIIPGYFADPTVKKFGDTYYIYATTDGNGGGFGPSQVWTSKDFVNWTMQDMNWPTTHHYWAPDATLGPDGKYYLYYCQPVEIFGASSTSPVGPWTSLLAPGKPIVSNFMVPNVITLDGQTFKDDDGKYYMYCGTWGIYPNHGCGVGLLNPDMKSFSKLAQIPNTDAKDFFEAPFVFKRKGIYYLTYSSGYCEDGTYRVQYATATNPMGPFKYAKENPILATNVDGTVHGPGHQSVLQQGDDFYLIYHRHNNPHNDGGYHRQVAADKIIFDENGAILKLVPTHTGVGFLAKNVNPHVNLALGKKVLASSEYDQDFKAEYAVDDNNGTLWKAKNNVGSAWITLDLGKEQTIKSVHTQFEYATWYYQYQIEYSVDGKNWQLYADKSKNTQHGSPMVDYGNVKARYLKTTILRTEYPGLNKAIWNIKVFDNDAYKPLTNTVVKKWESLESFESIGLLVDLKLDSLRIGSVVSNIANTGKLGGVFSADGGNKPVVSMIEGKKALILSGAERFTSSKESPKSLMGNSSYSVSMWVLNPDIDKEETIVSWTERGGVNLSNVAIGYGSGKAAGATTHLGWADLGYKNLPKANEWHLITFVFDGTMERIYVDGTLDRAERRMLFVNNLKNFLLGGNEDGTGGFSGALASLKIYDIPLTEEEIKTSYLKGINTNTVLYADAKNLKDGKVESWRNEGTALETLIAKGNAQLQDVQGKIAVLLNEDGEILLDNELMKSQQFSKSFTAIFSLLSTAGSKTKVSFGPNNPTIEIMGDGKWQQVICSNNEGKLTVFVNGKQLEKAVLHTKQIEPNTLIAHIKKGGSYTAISSIYVYNSSFDSAAVLEEFNFWKETLNTQTAPASFSLTPTAISPSMVYMEANKPSLPGSQYEYLFSRSKEGFAANWSRSANFIDFSVLPQNEYTYNVKVRDNFGNVSEISEPFKLRTDTTLFVIKKQSGQAQSTHVTKDALQGTCWDGFTGTADTVSQQAGVLKMISHNTLWDGSPTTGPFAYFNVKGDFVAEVMVEDMIGLKQRKAYGANEVGILVKSAQQNAKLVQNGIMPGWGVGNIVTNLNNRGRRQSNNMSGWNFYRYLQIQKIGNTFFLRGSKDGRDWKNLPGSPIQRDDLEKDSLQVGVYHATYGDAAGYGTFSNFKLIQKR
ncbi:family 43 glycosylhydrolase [Pedobacter sp. MW01-1-1]|uniref:family 43 glycosylhydrolase n=1 Tax=Pedobacter sp. MW01-1-1 TaxID=3383027 RepID=UPI003FEEA4AE